MKDPERRGGVILSASRGGLPFRSFTLAAVLLILITAGLGFTQTNPDAPQEADQEVFPSAASDSPLRDAATETPRALAVNTILVRSVSSIEQQRVFRGLIRARRVGDLNFARAGAVSKVLVAEGQTVEAGQRIAELDMSRLERQQTALQEALQTAEADLQKLTPDAPELTVNGMRLELRRLRGEIDRMDAQLAQMPAAAPAPMMERLRSTEQQIAAMDQADRRRNIQAASQRIGELQGQLEDLRLELQEGVLTAPYAGVVGARYVNEGASVSPAAPIVRLAELATLQAWIGLPADLADDLELGTEFQLIVDNDAFPAIALAKLPEVDRSSRIRTVILEFPARPGILPGRMARLEVSTKISLQGTWLPLTALDREVRGLWSVLVVEGLPGRQKVARRFVEIAYLERDRALVQGGVNDGELVVIDGLHRLVPGQFVTPLPAPSPRISPPDDSSESSEAAS